MTDLDKISELVAKSEASRVRSVIFDLWHHHRMHTKAIADTLQMTEAEVANALPSILQGERK